MNNRKRTVFFLLFFIIFASCAPKEEVLQEEHSYLIGVITKSRDSEYWMSVCSGIEKAATDYHVSVIILSPDTETNKKLQKKMIYDLIDKGIDALAISPIDSYDAEDYVSYAKEKEIPIFAYDTEIVGMAIPYIGINNKKAGYNLAKSMAKQLNNKGRVGIISGDLAQTAHKKRIEGFQQYMKQHTNIEIAFIESGYSNLRLPEQEISKLLKKNKDISGIFATSAVTALGIVEYIKEQPIKVVTVDAQNDALEAVKNGKISALVLQSGFDIGYETIQYIVKNREIKGGLEKGKIIDAQIIVTEENK